MHLWGSDGKEYACNAGDLGSTPGLRRCPEGRHGNPLQYSCLENPHGQRSLVGYSPWDWKDSDMTEWLSMCSSVFLETSICASTNLFIPCRVSIHKIPGVSCTNLFDHWPKWKWGQDKEFYSMVLLPPLQGDMGLLIITLWVWLFMLGGKNYEWYCPWLHPPQWERGTEMYRNDELLKVWRFQEDPWDKGLKIQPRIFWKINRRVRNFLSCSKCIQFISLILNHFIKLLRKSESWLDYNCIKLLTL